MQHFNAIFNNKHILPILCGLTLLCGTFSLNTAQADQSKWYQIELIIFSYTNPQINTELWPDNTTNEATSVSFKTTELHPAMTGQPTSAYQQVPEKDFQLTQEAQQITKNKTYQLLLHTAWLQPGLKKSQAKTIHIWGGDAYNQQGEVIDPDSQDAETVDIDPPARIYWQVDGAIKFSLARYWNLDTHLYLLKNIANFPSTNHPIKLFRNQTPRGFRGIELTESRRMKNNQLNYVDHPLFGMLVKIIPVQPPTQILDELSTAAEKQPL